MSDLLPSAALLARGALAFLPVAVFLGVLLRLDTFRLVRRAQVVRALAFGAAAAGLSFLVDSWLALHVRLPVMTFAVLLAPLVEEGIKGAYALWLVATRRAAFLVDAAILGFGVGAGFALAENLYYLRNLADAPLLVWVVRGLGTALMHGGATATAAVLMQGYGRRPWAAALAVAVLLHAAFNRFLDHPLAATAAAAAGVPLVFWWAYRRGEARLRRWLGQGLDRDAQLLLTIRRGEVGATPLGRHLAGLRGSLRPDTVADLLCLLRLQAELNVMAKGALILREHGLPVRAHPRLQETLRELRWLEAAVGRTGLLALRPLRERGERMLWQRRLLEEMPPQD